MVVAGGNRDLLNLVWVAGCCGQGDLVEGGGDVTSRHNFCCLPLASSAPAAAMCVLFFFLNAFNLGFWYQKVCAHKIKPLSQRRRRTKENVCSSNSTQAFFDDAAATHAYAAHAFAAFDVLAAS